MAVKKSKEELISTEDAFEPEELISTEEAFGEEAAAQAPGFWDRYKTGQKENAARAGRENQAILDRATAEINAMRGTPLAGPMQTLSGMNAAQQLVGNTLAGVGNMVFGVPLAALLGGGAPAEHAPRDRTQPLPTGTPYYAAPLADIDTRPISEAIGKAAGLTRDVWAQNTDPNTRSSANALLGITGLTGVKPIAAGGKTLAEMGAASMAQRAEEATAKALRQGVEKGIKPTVVGKGSIKKLDKFYTNTESAVESIAENRGKLNLDKEAEQTITRPRNIREMATAIDQTKKAIYQKYNDMSVAAGEGGVRIDVEPVIKDLEKIATKPGEVLPENSPKLSLPKEIREYANRMIDEVEELHGASPEILEERIKDLNNSLKGYYEGRTTQAKAQVDASVANLLRRELDKRITSAVGEGYQDLKNKYGALTAIEKEVNHRALVDARKNTKGLTDLSDVFTGGELVGGLLSANPALIAKGVTGKAIATLHKKLNDPNRYIDKMFKRVYNKVPEKADEPLTINPTTLGAMGQPGPRRSGPTLKQVANGDISQIDPFWNLPKATKYNSPEAIERANMEMAAASGRDESYYNPGNFEEALTPTEEKMYADMMAQSLEKGIDPTPYLRRKYFNNRSGEVDLGALKSADKKRLSKFVESVNTMHDHDYAQWVDKYGTSGFPDISDLAPDNIVEMINTRKKRK